MKRYRCIFSFAQGRPTTRIYANDAISAIAEAAITEPEADAIEIWDETGLVRKQAVRLDLRLRAACAA